MLNSAVSDSGEYVCVLKNDAGSTQSACNLTVQAKKDMESEFRSQTLRQVETVQTQQVQQVIGIRSNRGVGQWNVWGAREVKDH